MSRTGIVSRLTAGLVALVAGYASFSHIYSVARQAGEHVSVAAVLPLSIDGLILVGALAMLDDKRSGRKPRLSARLAVAFGIIAILAASIASAQPTWTARVVAVVPLVAFLLAVEVLSCRGKLIRTEEPAVQVAEPAVVQEVNTELARLRPAPRSLTDAGKVKAAHLAHEELISIIADIRDLLPEDKDRLREVWGIDPDQAYATVTEVSKADPANVIHITQKILHRTRRRALDALHMLLLSNTYAREGDDEAAQDCKDGAFYSLMAMLEDEYIEVYGVNRDEAGEWRHDFHLYVDQQLWILQAQYRAEEERDFRERVSDPDSEVYVRDDYTESLGLNDHQDNQRDAT